MTDGGPDGVTDADLDMNTDTDEIPPIDDPGVEDFTEIPPIDDPGLTDFTQNEGVTDSDLNMNPDITGVTDADLAMDLGSEWGVNDADLAMDIQGLNDAGLSVSPGVLLSLAQGDYAGAAQKVVMNAVMEATGANAAIAAGIESVVGAELAAMIPVVGWAIAAFTVANMLVGETGVQYIMSQQEVQNFTNDITPEFRKFQQLSGAPDSEFQNFWNAAKSSETHLEQYLNSKGVYRQPAWWDENGAPIQWNQLDTTGAQYPAGTGPLTAKQDINPDRTGDTGCFITEAVMSTSGQGDNAEELQVLRGFRDTVLMQTPEGRSMVDEYYQIAPVVVDAIAERPDGVQIFQNLKAQFIDPAVAAVKAGDNEQALQIYAEMIAYASQFAAEGSEEAGEGYGMEDAAAEGAEHLGEDASMVASSPEVMGAATGADQGHMAMPMMQPQAPGAPAGGMMSPQASMRPSEMDVDQPMPGRMFRGAKMPPQRGIMPMNPNARPPIADVYARR